MASARLNIFDSFPLLNNASSGDFLSNVSGQILMHQVMIPGSISFNKVAVLFNGNQAAANSRSITLSFGLYSLNGSTLSLANSASNSRTFTAGDGLSFFSLATSANQDITPGNWYFAIMSSRTGGAAGAGYGLVANSIVSNLTDIGYATGLYGGPFFMGAYSTTTNVFPASINTSAMIKAGSGSSVPLSYPYILISA